jgi:Kef-type K+ transport system membrane component KefB
MITRRQQSSLNKRRQGFTVIEVLEGVAACFLAFWLAEKLSSYCEDFWRTSVLWTVTTVGSVAIFFILLYGFGYLFHYLSRRKKPKPPETN